MSHNGDIEFSSMEGTPLIERIEALSQDPPSEGGDREDDDGNARSEPGSPRSGSDHEEVEGSARAGGRARQPSAPFPASQDSEADVEGQALQDYWSSIPELQEKLLMTWNVSCSGSLTPDADDMLKMCGVSKAFKLVPPDSPGLLCSPYDGQSYMFVARSLGEIPDYAQQVIWFFSNLRNSITDYANYCFPTNKVALRANRGDPKVITNLVAISEPAGGYGRSAAPAASFIDMGRFMRERRNHHSGVLRTPLKALKIQVGWTGAWCDDGGQQRREAFCCVIVTPASNFHMWQYIYDVHLRQPKTSDKNYERLMAEYTVNTATLKRILWTEASTNLGMDPHSVMSLEDFRLSPGAEGGVHSLLNVFQLPCKIFTLMKERYPQLSGLEIMNLPRMTFRYNDERTTRWLSYMNHYINAAAEYEEQYSASMNTYWMTKEKERHTLPDFEQRFIGGWPLEFDSDCRIIKFGLPPLPLLHDFVYDSQVSSFQVWLSNIGGPDGLPELTQALLRAFHSKSSEVNAYPNIKHFITGWQAFTPIRWSEMYSGEADVLRGLVVDGRLMRSQVALQKDMRERRANGATVPDMVQTWQDYVHSSVYTLKSMLRNGVFNSKTLVDSLNILELVDWAAACTDGDDSIRATVQEFSAQTPALRKHDGFAVCLKAFWRVWEYVNSFYYMNSPNLVFAIELMVSQLMYRFGDSNESWTNFFNTIIIMSGNGHYMVNTPEGVMRDSRKPNSTGNDYVKARVAALKRLLYVQLGMTDKRKHYQLVMDLTRWTDTAFENLATATIALGTIRTVPDQEMRDRSLAAPEVRQGKKAIIQHVCSRGETAGDTCTTSSCQPGKDGIYSSMIKPKVTNPNLVAMAGNTGDATKASAEETNSLMVVTCVLPPGAAPQTKKRSQDGNLKRMHASSFTRRPRPIQKERQVANFLSMSHVFVGCYGGLLNRLGAVNYEIPVVIAAYTEWLHALLRDSFKMMDPGVVESYSRMKEGYQARGLVLAAWVDGIRRLSEEADPHAASRDLLLSLEFNPMPLAMVPVSVGSLLSRAVHMPSLVLTTVLADHLQVPVVSWPGLCAFFKDQAAPTPASAVEYEAFTKIRNFVQACILHHRFCPETDEPFSVHGNVSCYVTSNGTPEHRTEQHRKGILRITDPKRNWEKVEDVLKTVANQIKDAYGQQLFQNCHMGPEACVINHALHHMLFGFDMSARSLCGDRVYHSRDHLEKLGLLGQLPGVANADEDAPVSYMRRVLFTAHEGHAEEVRSGGVGVNLWGLLVMVSLIGNKDITVHVSDDVARHLLQNVLALSPAGCTPGNQLSLRSFNSFVKNEELVIPARPRLHHFLRPESDTFASTGVLLLAPAVEDSPFLPEDLLHAPFFPEMWRRYKCKWDELPASAVRASYSLMPNVDYAWHRPGTGEHGLITAQTAGSKMVIEYYQLPPGADRSVPDHGETVLFDRWEQAARERGIVLTPAIWRAGACVRVQEASGAASVGVLVRAEGADTLLHKATCSYAALVRRPSDEEQSQHPSQPPTQPPAPSTVHLPLVQAISALLPVGEPLYLNHACIDKAEFRKVGKLLKVRLNVPNTLEPEDGRVYVTCHYSDRPFGRPDVASLPSVTMTVDPWDLTLPSEYKGPAGSVLEFLQPNAAPPAAQAGPV